MSLVLNSGFTIGPGVTLDANPTRIIPTNGLILQLDASIYSGTSTWPDLSPAGNNSTLMGTATHYDAGQQSYFSFNSNAAAEVGSILPNTAYTKIGIFRIFGNYVNLISGNATDQHAFWGAATPYLQSGHNGVWSTIVSPVVTPTNQWVFGAVSFNTTTGWRLYLNNETVVTNADTTPFTANPGYVEIGGFDGLGNTLVGDVAVVMIYNRAISDEEVESVRTYYQTRFGL